MRSPDRGGRFAGSIEKDFEARSAEDAARMVRRFPSRSFSRLMACAGGRSAFSFISTEVQRTSRTMMTTSKTKPTVLPPMMMALPRRGENKAIIGVWVLWFNNGKAVGGFAFMFQFGFEVNSALQPTPALREQSSFLNAKANNHSFSKLNRISRKVAACKLQGSTQEACSLP
jgi:hypothetical protein